MPAPQGRPQLRIRADELRRRRLRAALTRRQLSHLSGLSRRRIDELEQDYPGGIRPETARKLATALGCSVDDLIEVVDRETA